MIEDRVSKTKAERTGQGSAPTEASVKGYYGIVATATAIGIIVVAILNLATPLESVLGHLRELARQDPAYFRIELAKRAMGLLMVILGICLPLLIIVRQALRPIFDYLGLSRNGGNSAMDLREQARRRLLNLPFIFIPINVGMWIIIPAGIFISAHFAGNLDMRTALIFSIRASMVGLISSAIASFWIESYSRRRLIPFFFPKGHLAEVKGAARLSISKRVRLLFRLGSMVPMTILVVTLLTLQWEVDSATISAKDYGRGILSFTLVLFGISFFMGSALNKFVSRSIVSPLEKLMAIVPRVQDGDYSSRIRVVSNDEIGVLGDAGNAMIRGLAEREIIRTAFGRYVTPEIRDEILSGRIPLDGEVKEVTVLFSDLRDFTPLVESTPPKEVVHLINGYFEEMAEGIKRHKGLVLQFIGDEIEAVFGAPLPLPDHATSAIHAALEMRARLKEYNAGLKKQGYGLLSHGIGIHTGYALAANIGSPQRLSYALVGDTVNLASRLEGLSRDLGHDIIISEATWEALGDQFNFMPLPPAQVKGKSKAVKIFALT